MILLALAVVSCALAAIPAALGVWNLALYRRSKPASGPVASRPAVSVLIPARNEERNIATAVESARASRGVDLEVIVLDDHSEDRTPAIVGEISKRDSRVRLLEAPPLSEGWCGKQHACQRLSEAATHDVMVFMDADVTLAPDALAGIVGFLEASRADLVSGFPRQTTGSLLERMLIPLIHFVLLGYLPLAGMRLSARPSFAAGCGQLIATRREAYRRAGGHAAIRASRHDGLELPRAFRKRGLRTDLFDATDSAVCRMYRGSREVWNGLAKNAVEGMASPAGIVPWTVLLGGGQVLPPFVLVAGLISSAGPAVTMPALAAVLMSYGMRAVLALRFRQPWLGVLLHPVGVALLLSIQWYALLLHLRGRSVSWKGRQLETGL